MTHDPSPQDPFERDLSARMHAAADHVGGAGVTRRSVEARVAPASLRRRRSAVALSAAAAVLVLSGIGVAVAAGGHEPAPLRIASEGTDPAPSTTSPSSTALGPVTTTSTVDEPVTTTSTVSEPVTTTSVGPVPPTTRPPAPTEPLAVGAPVGRLRIAAIGLDASVVEGVEAAQLGRGPGHDPGTALPGHRGNVVIAGHRTAAPASFADLDLLRSGDRIVFDTSEGQVAYEVVGTQIVEPDDLGVRQYQGDDRLTLVAEHPKHDASKRIVVTARLVGEPLG